jgi:general secretion pathway protein F
MEYRFRAVNTDGAPVAGRLSAASEREALRQLRARDLVALELARGNAGASRGRVRGSRRLKPADLAISIRELATLLSAGVPLAEAVNSLAQAHAEDPTGIAYQRVYRGLTSGVPFSAAIQSSGLELPAYVHQLAAAGELSGKLAQALRDAATQMEYDEQVARDVRTALVYPSVLVASGIAAVLVVFIVVVPRFANILKSTRAEVPALSKWVIGAGVFVKDNLLWVALLLAAAIAAMVFTLRRREVRARIYQGLARAPLIGAWLQESETGKWAATLGTLLENRVPLVAAMELVEGSVGLEQLRRQLQQALKDVRAGKKLADALEANGALPPTGLNLLRVGERSGELPEMLRALAALHSDAARDRMKRFLALLEPAAIIVIGGVIGVIMIAVMLAITSLTNVRVT